MIVFISGSESTGKTELCKGLSAKYKRTWIPEYARSYIENLNRSYTFEDVENIARHQIDAIKDSRSEDLIFIDTGLIITKVWFERKYNRVPVWFQKEYLNYTRGSYIICDPDLPWEPDPVRENPEIRQELNHIYQEEIVRLGYPFYRVSGLGDTRLLSAIGQINKWLTEERENEK